MNPKGILASQNAPFSRERLTNPLDSASGESAECTTTVRIHRTGAKPTLFMPRQLVAKLTERLA